MMNETPYYLIDEMRLIKNLEKVRWLRLNANVKSVLALKCFSTWPVFDVMRPYLDGTTSSSLYEAKLGYEKFGKEVHVYGVAFSRNDVDAIRQYADKIIFNSIGQLESFHSAVRNLDLGLRINPQVSYSDYELADPARQHSRLGVTDYQSVLDSAALINGVMFHYNCENPDFENFSNLLDFIALSYREILLKVDWVSLGGGVYFTLDEYPLKMFADKLKKFSETFAVQIYLEPGEAVVTESVSLVASVLDIVSNEIDIAIIDSSIESHMPDLLTYRVSAEFEGGSANGKYKYLIGGQSCLAGDIFGKFCTDSPLQVGDRLHVADAGGYTMVKMNWFNGLKMPSILFKRVDGTCELLKSYGYTDFKGNLG